MFVAGGRSQEKRARSVSQKVSVSIFDVESFRASPVRTNLWATKEESWFAGSWIRLFKSCISSRTAFSLSLIHI